MVAGGAEELDPTQVAVFDTLYATSDATTRRDHAAAVRRATATAWCSARARARSARGSRARAGARRAHSCGDRGLRHQLRRQPRHLPERRRRCRWRCSSRSTMRGCRRRRSATSTRTAPRPTAATSPKATRPRSVRRAHADQLAEELHGTHARRVRRAGGVDDHRDDARRWFAPTSTSSSRSRLRRARLICGEGRRIECEYVMSNNFAFGGINTSLIFRRYGDVMTFFRKTRIGRRRRRRRRSGSRSRRWSSRRRGRCASSASSRPSSAPAGTDYARRDRRAVKLPPYGVRVLLEAGLGIGLLIVNDGRYTTTRTAQFILHDTMTRVNMDFVHDVNYKGLYHLTEAIAQGAPGDCASSTATMHGVCGAGDAARAGAAELVRLRALLLGAGVPGGAAVGLRAPGAAAARRRREYRQVGAGVRRVFARCLRHDVRLAGAIGPRDRERGASRASARISACPVDIFLEGRPALRTRRDLDEPVPRLFLGGRDRLDPPKGSECDVGGGEALDPRDVLGPSAVRECRVLPAADLVVLHGVANGNSQLYHSTVMHDCIERAGLGSSARPTTSGSRTR